MKKTAIVNGKARRIEFSYAVGETISLSNTEVKKPWGRVTERVTVSKLTFTINGKTYEGTRTFKVAGGPYSETFEFDGNSFASHWKSHATLTLLATQDLPTFGYNMIDPLKSWCWGSILFYPFKISRFS